MGKSRLEAFSDGVIAILITIMVLELKVPKGEGFAAFAEVFPVLMSYLLSFVYLGIYWNNHHHLLHTVTHVRGGMLWANLHLLFWLSLIPFATSWSEESHFAPVPTAFYGAVLFLAACAYYLLQLSILKSQGPSSVLAKALGSDLKGKLSPLIYASAIGLAFVSPPLANALYVLVAIIWLVPDRRIEREV